VGRKCITRSSIASTDLSCTNHNSNTAGMAARYVPTNGTAPNIAATAG